MGTGGCGNSGCDHMAVGESKMKRLACLVCLTVILIVGLMIGVLGLCLIASAVIGHVEVVAVGALLIVNLALLDLCRSL